MELIKIESLLEAYLEGATSLEEENVLREYFSGEEIAPQLEVYKTLFAGFEQAKEEVMTKEVILPESSYQIKSWWYGIAAMLIVGVTVGGFLVTQSGLSQDEQYALAEYNKARESMLLLSQNLNKGTQELALIDEFTKGTSSMLHINQFTNAKNKILK